MRITQSYTGTTSHLLHTKGNYTDYPIDEGCENSGKSYMYCPCDKMKIKRIYGVGTGGTNTMWLESEDKVTFADGTRDYFTMLVTHPDDSELKKLRVGQSFSRKEKICLEGKDGASGNHFHISGGKGKMKATGWMKNSNGKWVLSVTGNTCKPEKMFFVDSSFTEIKNSKCLKFEILPLEKKYKTGDYEVTEADLLNVRTGAGTVYRKKRFSELTQGAQKQILSLRQNKTADGYVRGTKFTVYEVKENWGRTPSGWVCLDYCEVI